MSVRFVYLLAEVTAATSLAILIVALTRKPVRQLAGAQVAYWLWLLVPVSVAVLMLPSPAQPLAVAVAAFPELLLSVLPPDGSSGNTADTAARFATTVLVAWFSGSLLMLAFMVRRHRDFRRSLGNLTSMQDGTFRSAVCGPVLIGVLRPQIVFPADFETVYSHEQRAMVLAHEQAHLRRGDVPVNAFATLWLCLFWFNPLSYWAIARLRLDQELACDAAALPASGTGRRRYADALFKAQLASEGASRTPVGCHWFGHPLKERVAMLKYPPPSRLRRWFGAILASVLIIGSGYTLWMIQPTLAHADEQYLNELQATGVADRISTLPNGNVELLGNVAVSFTRTDSLPLQVSSHSAEPLPDGGLKLEGAVRISRQGKDVVLTSDRAVFKNETITMDSAVLARISQPE